MNDSKGVEWAVSPVATGRICRDTYEQVEPQMRARTHTCDLPTGHEADHHCPACGNSWRRPERALGA